MRRTPLKATAALARRTPLLNRTAKRRRPRYTGPVRTVRDLVWERDEDRCSVCGEGGRPLSIHHRRNRGAGGSSNPQINSPANLLLVCDGPESCHRWIGDNPYLAGDAGYVIGLNSIVDPATVRVLHAVHGPVLLMHNGLVRPAAPTDLTEVNDR